jgi:5-methylcytosine-specific restriction endonuclease McrA
MRNYPNPFNADQRRYLRYRMFVAQEGLCFYCGIEMHILQEDVKPTPHDAATIDHRVPISKRPDLKKDPSNLVLACSSCNSKKGAEEKPPQRKRSAA